MENRLIPMRELLADMLLEAGQPQAALREYEASLVNAPNRFRSYAGAAKAAEAAKDPGKAKGYYGKLVTLAASAEGERSVLSDAKRVLQQG
jgi:Tfp pilus assembly protein PilF